MRRTRASHDDVNAFLATHTTPDPIERVTSGELWEAFKVWAEVKELFVIDNKKFLLTCLYMGLYRRGAQPLTRNDGSGSAIFGGTARLVGFRLKTPVEA